MVPPRIQLSGVCHLRRPCTLRPCLEGDIDDGGNIEQKGEANAMAMILEFRPRTPSLTGPDNSTAGIGELELSAAADHGDEQWGEIVLFTGVRYSYETTVPVSQAVFEPAE